MPQLRLANVLSSSTAELIAPPAPRTRAGRQPPAASERRPSRSGRLYLIVGAVALVISALSLLIPSTPSYDPWAWLVWGREIVHLNLHTTAGPSWKPLPVLFTTLFAPFGKAAPDMWLVVARAGTVIAAVMCFKVAWRLTRQLSGARGEHAGAARLAGLVPPLLAALIAAGTLINSPQVLSENALGYSEGLMTALVLIALERHLDGARRQAFVVGFFAALDRPELWVLLIPYGVYLWRKDAGSRKLVLPLFLLLPVLWFLPELWGSGHLLRGVARAQTPRSNSPAYAKCPFCTEFDGHALPSALSRVEIVALLAMAAAALGLWRTRTGRLWRGRLGAVAHARAKLLVIGIVGFAWWLGVAIETQEGFSGNDRYLVLGTALVAIAGGVGWAWGASAAAKLLRGRTGAGAVASGAVAVTLAVALFMALPPWIGSKVLSIPGTHGSLAYQADLRTDLSKAVREVGGPARIRRCGTVMTEGFQVPMVAWTLGAHTDQVEAPPRSAAQPGPPPNVIFQTRATKTAFLLPIVHAWKSVHYRLVAHVRTFSVYSSCADKVPL